MFYVPVQWLNYLQFSFYEVKIKHTDLYFLWFSVERLHTHSHKLMQHDDLIVQRLLVSKQRHKTTKDWGVTEGSEGWSSVFQTANKSQTQTACVFPLCHKAPVLLQKLTCSLITMNTHTHTTTSCCHKIHQEHQMWINPLLKIVLEKNTISFFLADKLIS